MAEPRQPIPLDEFPPLYMAVGRVSILHLFAPGDAPSATAPKGKLQTRSRLLGRGAHGIGVEQGAPEVGAGEIGAFEVGAC